MAIRTRADALPYTTGIDTPRLLGVSKLLAALTGHAVQPNKAIVGQNAFAHESGIHQDGMLKNALTYEIMTPASVGWTRSNLVLGKHSGRVAFRDKLADLGYAGLADAAVNAAFARFKKLCDRKKEVFDADIEALLDDAAAADHARIAFVALEARSSSRTGARAEVELTVDGEAVRGEGTGDGPVDAAFAALREAVPHEAVLELYSVGAVTAGSDAQARTTVRLDRHGRTVDGQAADPDTVVSAARAYVHALNKLLATRARAADATPYRMELA